MRRRWEDTLAPQVADRLGPEGRARIWTPDQTALAAERAKRAGERTGFAELDRRGFVLQSLKVGTAAGFAWTMLPACGGGTEPTGPADGSFEAPWTEEEPSTGTPTTHFPVVYAAMVDQTNIRLWVEVLDANAGIQHEAVNTHFIQTLVIQDEFNNDIAAAAFRYDNDARLIAQTTIPQGVTYLKVLAQCSQYGWHMRYYSIESLQQAPIGDLRRPYTYAMPGELPTKHQPYFGRRPNGDYSVEIGDRNGDGLHPMAADHYENAILVFDQYHQLRAGTYLDPNYNADPVYDFPAVGGTQYVRVLASCNLHGWWEAVFSAT